MMEIVIKLDLWLGEMRKVIGIDIDEVLADFNSVLQPWHNRNYGTNLKREDMIDYDLWNIWGCQKDEAFRRVHDGFYPSQDFERIKPFEGSPKGTLLLGQRYDSFCITSRPSAIHSKTVRWIGRYFPSTFSDIYSTNSFGLEGPKRKKSEICKELGVCVMIEDSPTIALECYEAGIGVALVNQPWNMRVSLPSKIVRVGDPNKADAWRNGLVEAVQKLAG